MGGNAMKYLILLVILFGVLTVLYYRLKSLFASLLSGSKPASREWSEETDRAQAPKKPHY